MCAIYFVFFGGCKKENLYYFPDEMAAYLGLDDQQKEKILPKLVDIQRELIDFYKKWTSILRKQGMALIAPPDSALEASRQKVREDIRQRSESLLPLLRLPQQEKLASIGFPELNLNEFMKSRRNIEMERWKNLKGDVRLNPSQFLSEKDITAAAFQELWDSRTIVIGKSFFGGSKLGSTSNEFPLIVWATLMDPVLTKTEKQWRERQKKEKPDSVVSDTLSGDKSFFQVRLALTTYFHESYLDLTKWIVYLETDDGTKIEPIRFMQQKQAWITEKPDPFSHIAMFSDSDSTPETMTMQENTGIEMSRNRRTFYTLFFPQKYSGTELITSNRRQLKLIFLNEVRGNEKGEGSWKFEWQP